MEHSSALAKVASLIVPAYADCCVIDIVTPANRLQRVAARHADPSWEPLAFEESARWPARGTDHTGPGRVLGTGQSWVCADVSGPLLASCAQDADHLAMLRSLGLSSTVSVPLRAHGQTVGAALSAAAGALVRPPAAVRPVGRNA